MEGLRLAGNGGEGPGGSSTKPKNGRDWEQEESEGTREPEAAMERIALDKGVVMAAWVPLGWGMHGGFPVGKGRGFGGGSDE